MVKFPASAADFIVVGDTAALPTKIGGLDGDLVGHSPNGAPAILVVAQTIISVMN